MTFTFTQYLTNLWDEFSIAISIAISILSIGLSLWASIHVILYKNDSKSAAGWVGIIVLSPFIGAILYYLIGINRIQRKALRLSLNRINKNIVFDTNGFEKSDSITSEIYPLIKTGESLGFSPMCKNFTVELLKSGNEAYPEMLNEIRKSKKSITLVSYIFDKDDTGGKFIDALIEAHKRGVKVRVLIDDVGGGFWRSRAVKELQKNDVPAASFLEIKIPLRNRFSNLRNHRKILVVDSKVGFTGGLNISSLYWSEIKGSEAIDDLHFKFEGRVVLYLQQAFVDDWFFTTGEKLTGPDWFSENLVSKPKMGCVRVIPDAPVIDSDFIKWSYLAAINNSKNSIKILTPYFLPDSDIVSGLCAAALRGVDVTILVPETLDHRFVQWAFDGTIKVLVKMGCKVMLSPKSFDHSKLFIVDNNYVSVGSSNWDYRSLRLNFELNVEVFSKSFNNICIDYFENKKKKAKILELDSIENRPFLIKIRNGIARLFSPYL